MKPKPQGLKFHARLKYTFSRYSLEGCTRCGKKREEHVDGKCLFESTVFKQSELIDFFEHLLRTGGTIRIVAGKKVLTQKLHARAVDQGADLVIGDIETDGNAFIGDVDAP